MADEGGWIAGERPGDGEMRRLGDLITKHVPEIARTETNGAVRPCFQACCFPDRPRRTLPRRCSIKRWPRVCRHRGHAKPSGQQHGVR